MLQQYRKRPQRILVALLLLTQFLLLSFTVEVLRVEGWLIIIPSRGRRRIGQSAKTRLLLSLQQQQQQQRNDTSTNGLMQSVSSPNFLEEDEKLRFGGVARLYSAGGAAAGSGGENTADLVKIQSTATTTAAAAAAAAAAAIDAIDDDSWTILQRLQTATVAVFGLGGVGSWSAEALCRSGIGNLILVDLDDICVSNTNRQLHALSSTVGNMKIDEMKRRLQDINPTCNVTLIHDFVSEDNAHDLLQFRDNNNLPTAVLDAIDGSKEKSALLAACVDLKIPVVTVGGAAGRKDPTQIFCRDLTHVSGDKLLATCRKNLRKCYGFGQGLSFRERKKKTQKLRKWNIACVYSAEEQKSLPDGRSDSDTSSLRRCDSALGTACFVTGTFGFVAAARVVNMIAENKLTLPRRR